MRAHKVLFAIPPYLGDQIEAIRPGKLRSFFAFPYGVLCLASYINKATGGAHDIKIVDLNQYSAAEGRTQFAKALADFEPDIVGISVMFDVSYKHVDGLAAAAKAANPDAKVLLGGAAVTTAWNIILQDQPNVDAICYSEGELAFVQLLNSDDPDQELLKDPWVTRQSMAKGTKAEDAAHGKSG